MADRTELRIGMRVRTNGTNPQYEPGREGTVLKLSWQDELGRKRAGHRKSEWIVVRFDDNPEYPAEWHRDYFDPIEPQM